MSHNADNIASDKISKQILRVDSLIYDNTAALFSERSVPIIGIIILVPAPLDNRPCALNCAVFPCFKCIFYRSYRRIVAVLEANAVFMRAHELSHADFRKLLPVHGARLLAKDVDIP